MAPTSSGIGDLPDGRGAGVYFGSQVVAVIEGHTADELFYQTIWIGNFNPGDSGYYDGDDSLEGTPGDDEIFAGAGADALDGMGGDDYLDAQEGDDLVIGTDDEIAEDARGDTLVGGGGDDTLRADAGDIVAGSVGDDTFEIVLLDGAGAPPVTIVDHDGTGETLTLLDAAGEPLPAEAVTTDLEIVASEDGTGAVLVFGGEVIAILEGASADALADPGDWIGNLQPAQSAPFAAPAPAPAPATQSEEAEADTTENTEIVLEGRGALEGAERISADLAVRSATATGLEVTSGLFGGNAVFSVNTDQGAPSENYQLAVDELDIRHLRYPAGQADSGLEEEDGDGYLDIVRMERGADGEMELRDELVEMLDYARDPDGDGRTGDAIQVTLVIPTKAFTIPEYRAYADDIAAFVERAMRDYGDVIEAFEIGNEYWEIGETEYGTKADIAARAIGAGLDAAGIPAGDQPSVVVQMGSPFAGSEFHVSVDDRPFAQRVDSSNQQIIAQLGDEARDVIDGVVEHYYYARPEVEFDDSSGELGFIDRDLSTWTERFDKDLEVWITEWNVRTTNVTEGGMRAASVMLEQVENMVELGTDTAHVWPVKHNTDNDLSGRQQEPPVVDGQDRILNTINGATFDLMSSSLVGLELLELEFNTDEPAVEINAYEGNDRTVVYVASRSLEVVDLDIDFSRLVPEFTAASGVKVGIDLSGDSSDGVHFVPGEGYQTADSVFVKGQRYYYNENDVRARLTDVAFDSATVSLELHPFEVMEITFEIEGGTATPPDETPPGTDADDPLRGTDRVDVIRAGGGDDRIDALAGDDSAYGGDGSDSIYGWSGDDYIKGNAGDDYMSGDRGDDTVLGSDGDDVVRGREGDDVLNGQIGRDRLIGGEGADTVTGWAGGDIFVINEGHLAQGDTITDFEPRQDRIRVSLTGIDGLGDVSIVQRQDGVELRFAAHGRLFLAGDLTAAEVNDPRNFSFG
ncbi:calcium-binding protein [Salipiger mucosus]|uniref:Alkaline phosphatase n=1 Tax=Salipiger mucosus DSM 16094 TaxID=1123237 RepID=S9SGA3_9RHOB|nr:calcium-binding protein [Salipiger mucosus]EPX85334.1 hypothetical protein Salmuc_02713 [Salipiger mucosus DSM 16094]